MFLARQEKALLTLLLREQFFNRLEEVIEIEGLFQECDVALLPEALTALGPEVGPFTATFRLHGNQLLIEFPGRLVRAPSEALAERVSGALEEIETARARNIISRHTGFGRQLASSGVPMWQVDLPVSRR